MFIVLSCFEGIGLPLLEVQQTVMVIYLLILLFELLTLAKFLLRDSVELLQLESGLVKLVLEENYQPYNSLVIKY